MRNYFKNHDGLSPRDKIEAQSFVDKFLAGKIRILEIPAWIFAGKRCRDTNHMGRCQEPVFGDGNKCQFHRRFQKRELAMYVR